MLIVNLCHLLAELWVQFTDADTFQEVHYHPNNVTDLIIQNLSHMYSSMM